MDAVTISLKDRQRIPTIDLRLWETANHPLVRARFATQKLCALTLKSSPHFACDHARGICVWKP